MSLRIVPVLLLSFVLGCASAEPEATPTPEPTAAATPKATPRPTPEPLAEPDPALLAPEAATAEAPATYTVKLVTSEGDMLIDVTRAWAPKGADRFYNLVKIGYFQDVAFFRVIQGFMPRPASTATPRSPRRGATRASTTTRSRRATSRATSASPPRGRTPGPPSSSSTSGTTRGSTAWASRPSASCGTWTP